MQYEKASITKAIRRYLKNRLAIKKIVFKRQDRSGYHLMLNPGSDLLFLKVFSGKNECFCSNVSVPRFSDYVVRRKEYKNFIQRLKEKESK